jgi:2-polyprenyl-6-methoxyphenol hydroxylase-like FAD-dependent oxidoreductase
MDHSKVLISGAGIAGLTLAYWLEKYGFSPSLVEKRADLSDEGYMIDFLGPGFDVAEKMGLIEPLRERYYPIKQLIMVDEHGKQRAAMDIECMRKLVNDRYFSLMRGDLESVIYESVREKVPVQFGTQIDRIEDRGDHVRATLSNGEETDADLVIGADGIHSHVRRLCWGDERQFERFLGYYIACAIIENFGKENAAYSAYLEPHTQAAVYSLRGDRLATFFAFKSERREVKSRQAQEDLLKDRFGDQGWIVPELLERTLQSKQLYFDTVSQIQVDPWYKGRVGLVGDACQCLTLLAGQGASLAMEGAYLLASELQKAQGDHAAAFTAYQEKMKPEIEKEQEKARKTAGSFIPNSRFSIWLTAVFLKMAFLPGFRSLFLNQIVAKSILK